MEFHRLSDLPDDTQQHFPKQVHQTAARLIQMHLLYTPYSFPFIINNININIIIINSILITYIAP